MSDAKIAYLETLHAKQVIVNTMTQVIEHLVSFGTEGIQEIAQSDPEMLLSSLEQLVAVVKAQHDEHRDFVETHFVIMDRLDQIIDKPKQ